MRFLFIGPGYPGVPKAGHGSGIGTYLYELTQGLSAKGHECHVVVWGSVIRQPNGIEGPHMVDGVHCYVLGRTYWPGIERVFPDSRDAHNLVRESLRLDSKQRFDWIEVENEEGLDIGLQRKFADRMVLRVHTTSLQMTQTKNVHRRWAHRYRLRRERRSFRMARRTMTHLQRHADELMRLYPGMQRPVVVPHGVEIQERDEGGNLKDEASGTHAGDAVVEDSSFRSPRFLVVGTPDPRKGFDRIRPTAGAYAEKHGSCTVVIVSDINEYHRNRFQLVPPYPDGVSVEWLGALTREEMLTAYAQHDALFFPSRYESFGYPLIEAAALGIPVVSTDVGVAPDLMTKELSRYIVDGDDPAACAEALHAAAQDRKQIGLALKSRYSAQYTREVMVNNYLKRLEELDNAGRN